jgi:hypothetical protein
MSRQKELERAQKKAKISVSDIIVICQKLSSGITDQNFSTTEDSLPTGSIFKDSVSIRTIENWVAKIAFDMCKGREVRAFKICDVIDQEIRLFAEMEHVPVVIEKHLGRKLQDSDVVRLLWVGDQGCEFTKKFMTLFISHLKTRGNELLLLSAEEE